MIANLRGWHPAFRYAIRKLLALATPLGRTLIVACEIRVYTVPPAIDVTVEDSEAVYIAFCMRRIFDVPSESRIICATGNL